MHENYLQLKIKIFEQTIYQHWLFNLTTKLYHVFDPFLFSVFFSSCRFFFSFFEFEFAVLQLCLANKYSKSLGLHFDTSEATSGLVTFILKINEEMSNARYEQVESYSFKKTIITKGLSSQVCNKCKHFLN